MFVLNHSCIRIWNMQIKLHTHWPFKRVLGREVTSSGASWQILGSAHRLTVVCCMVASECDTLLGCIECQTIATSYPVVCHVASLCCANMAEWINVLFWVKSVGDQRHIVLDRGPDARTIRVLRCCHYQITNTGRRPVPGHRPGRLRP